MFRKSFGQNPWILLISTLSDQMNHARQRKHANANRFLDLEALVDNDEDEDEENQSDIIDGTSAWV